MLEQELKLSVEGAFAPTFPPGRSDVAGVDELPALDLRATYYDTPDLRLARNGVTLRCRSGEEGGPGWTLKLPVGDGIADGRDELHFEGGGQAGAPRRAQDLVRALVRSEALRPVARLRTQRRRWLLRDADGGELAELVDDRVSVIERGRVAERFREVEIEGRGVEREALERIAGVLDQQRRRAGGADAEARAGARRARRRRRPTSPPAEAPRPRDPAAARRARRDRGRRAPDDPERPAHPPRGGRAAPSDAGRDAPPAQRPAHVPAAARPGLGRVPAGRAEVARRVAGGGARPRRAARAPAPRGRGSGAATSTRCSRSSSAAATTRAQRLLGDLRSAALRGAARPAGRGGARAARCPTRGAAAQPRGAAARLRARSWRKLRTAGRARSTTTARDEELHGVRVLDQARALCGRGGRSRARAAGAARRASRFAERAADVQDVLGELQDSVVAARDDRGLRARAPARRRR